MPAFLRVALVVVLIGGAGCGGKKPPGGETPAPIDAGGVTLDPDEAALLAGGFRDMLEAMAEVVRARRGAACGGDAGVRDGDAGPCADCAAMAVDLGAVFDRAEPLFARAREVRSHDDSNRVFDDAMRAHERGVKALVDEISAGLAPCAGNAELVKVIERMPVL
jgi:hypothetical protein